MSHDRIRGRDNIGGLSGREIDDFTACPDRDLVDANRRHSQVSKHYGFDLESAHGMGRIEEEISGT